MHATSTLITVTLLAALLGGPALAGDHGRGDGARHADRASTTQRAPWQSVAHDARPGEPGHGWQYFIEPGTARAVAISPNGTYYLSRGKGLRWIAAASRPV